MHGWAKIPLLVNQSDSLNCLKAPFGDYLLSSLPLTFIFIIIFIIVVNFLLRDCNILSHQSFKILCLRVVRSRIVSQEIKIFGLLPQKNAFLIQVFSFFHPEMVQIYVDLKFSLVPKTLI